MNTWRRSREMFVESTSEGWTIKPKAGETFVGYSRTVVALVHGFNTDQDEASKAFRALRAALRRVGVDERVEDDIWDLYWPAFVPKGSWGWWHASVGEGISRASYPWMVWRAKAIGKVFAKHLRALTAADGSAPDLFLIGHSLGCRMILEALQSEHARYLRVRGLCLMAAAVPTAAVKPSAELGDAATLAVKTCVIFSSNDDVLFVPFRLGEFAATREWVEAVGRHGRPIEVWREPDVTRLQTSLKHNDYFRGKDAHSIGPSVTATPIGELLGRPVARELPTYQAAAQGWTLPRWMSARYNKITAWVRS